MLQKHKHYLQIALNSTLMDAKDVIFKLPPSDRIIIEAGTPLIKEFGATAISQIKNWWKARTMFYSSEEASSPYIVADLKCMDRGKREVEIAAEAGASAAVALGLAPVETLDVFIKNCEAVGIDSMIDLMNVDKPYQVLRELKTLPKVVILHRGVDEEEFSDKPIPIHLINKITGTFDVMIAVAGGDTIREIQSSIFNGADIVVVWKSFYSVTDNTSIIAEQFLKEIKE